MFAFILGLTLAGDQGLVPYGGYPLCTSLIDSGCFLYTIPLVRSPFQSGDIRRVSDSFYAVYIVFLSHSGQVFIIVSSVQNALSHGLQYILTGYSPSVFSFVLTPIFCLAVYRGELPHTPPVNRTRVIPIGANSEPSNLCYQYDLQYRCVSYSNVNILAYQAR